MTPRPGYTGIRDLPPLVRSAVNLAGEMRFEQSCHPGYGRLLQVLAARGARLAELGTGSGVGAAWMASAMPAGATLVTAEHNPLLAGAARELFAALPAVTVLEADWRSVLPLGPFDLVFVDAAAAKLPPGAEDLIDALAPGGIALLDDLRWGRPAEEDPVKAFWTAHHRLRATEVMAAPPDWAALLATRLGI